MSQSAFVGHSFSDVTNFGQWLDEFRNTPGFCYVKSNHGFWDRIGDVMENMPWPSDQESRRAADRRVGREGHGFFEDGFVDTLLALMAAIPEGDRLLFGTSMEAWTGSERFAGLSGNARRGGAVMARLLPAHVRRCDALLLKKAVETGVFGDFLKALRRHHLIVVGPAPISGFVGFARAVSGVFLEIHPVRARLHRQEIEEALCRLLDQAPDDRDVTVLIQAGTLAPYLILRLKGRYGRVRWVDCGMALNICDPRLILETPWGQIHGPAILAGHDRWVGRQSRIEAPVVALVDRAIAQLEVELATSRGQGTPYPRLPGFRHAPQVQVRLVEDKTPEPESISRFLSLTAKVGHWSNFGPLDEILADVLHHLGGFSGHMVVVPCASGTVALETLARLHDAQAGRPLRWAVCGFGYFNVVQGRFAGSRVVDCRSDGLLDLDALERLDPASWDGLVVTNPFGLAGGFKPYADFCRKVEKPLLLDNAAGFGNGAVPEIAFQAFSFHHTKPYGVGEGGAMLVPAELAETARRLIAHGRGGDSRMRALSGNGKMSEIAAAYLLDRLRRSPSWRPRYELQMARIRGIAQDAGLKPLCPSSPTAAVSMTLPVLAPRPVGDGELANRFLALGKSYRPLDDGCPVAGDLLARLVNIPCHPDVARLDRPVLDSLLTAFSS